MSRAVMRINISLKLIVADMKILLKKGGKKLRKVKTMNFIVLTYKTCMQKIPSGHEKN